MSLRRGMVEVGLRIAAGPSLGRSQPAPPESIFVLRNNDIGDVLAATPLFEALKKLFPKARICAGVGPWSFDVLRHNPWIDEVLPVSAPWHNKQTTRHAANSVAGWREALVYIFGSEEVRALRARRFSVGIDVLGSPQGSLLMLRAGIPFRLGVRGYAGGHTACQKWTEFDANTNVRRAALDFAELLGAGPLPLERPRIFLDECERAKAEAAWQRHGGTGSQRVVVAPGGGFAEKCWAPEKFASLSADFAARGWAVTIVGGSGDKRLAAKILERAPAAIDQTGATTLRETFALIERADLLLCNSSMAMHAGAALRKKVAAMLGPWYSDLEQHRRQWGYNSDFLMLGPDSAPEAVLRALEERGWLSARLQAA